MVARLTTVLWFCCLCGLPLFAEDSREEVAQHEPLRFRRHLIPQIEVSDRIKGGYMPLQRERFEEMLAEINASSTTASSETPVRIEQATYTGLLEGDQIVAGLAQLQIVRTSDTATVLPLAPCQIAVGRPVWTDDDTPASVGVDPTGQLLVLADRNATLQLNWSLRGERDNWGRLLLPLQLPPSAMNRLILDLPEMVRPIVDVGFAEPVAEETPTAEDVNESLGSVTNGEAIGRRKWLIELGGNNRATLTIEPEVAPLSQRQLVLARQATTYSFTESGLEIRTKLTLDVHHRPLERLELDVHPSLYIISARLGESALTVRTLHQSEDVARIAVDLPEPMTGAGREVILIAFTPLQTGKLWWLPTVRPVGVVWQQGHCVLEAPQGLAVERLITEACIETSVEPLPSPLEGEARNILLYTPDAKIGMQIAIEPPEFEFTCGTSIRLNENVISGRLVADVTSVRGSIFQLEARSLDGWIIDQVETIPADALARFVPRPGRQVGIRLARAVPTGQSVRVIVSAHRRLPSSQSPMSGSEFRMFELGNTRSGRDLMSIYAEPPYHLTIAGDSELSFLDPQRLDGEQRSRIETPAGAYVYRDTTAAHGLSIGLRREDPRYSATIAVNALIEAQSLTQDYAIRCEPSASRVARLTIRFSQPSDGAIQWKLEGEDDNGLTAVRQDSADVGGQGETWEINLHRPRNEPFQIQATQSIQLAGEARLSLASLPEATSQEATLEIGTSDGTPLSVRTDNLKAIPPTSDPYGARYPLIRAAYRYDPSRDAVAVVSRVAPEQAQKAAWIWSAHLVSRWESHGEATHEAYFFVENTGLSQVALVVPEGAEDVRCRVQNEEVYFSSAAATHVLRLPKNVRFPTVRVAFVSQGPGLGLTGRVRPTWPQLDLPCFDKMWSVWLPPGFAAASDARMLRFALKGTMRWDERLFGRQILRRSGRPFDLFSSEDWRQLNEALRQNGSSDAAARCSRSLEDRCRALTGRSGVPATWAELVEAYEEARISATPGAVNAALPKLWIDEVALRRLEISPGTELPLVQDPSQSVLGSRGLAIVASDTDVLLTSSFLAGEDGGLVRPPEIAHVVRLCDRRSFEDGLGVPPDGMPRMTVTEWTSLPPHQLIPWPEAQLCEVADFPLPGWSLSRIQVDLDNDAPLATYRPGVLRAISWGALLILSGSIGCFVRRRPFVLICLLATTGAVALVCPPVWVPVARGLFLGVLLGTALVLVQRPRGHRYSWSSTGSTRTLQDGETGSSRTVHALLLVALMLGSFASCSAAAQVSEAETPRRDAYPLLVPVDDAGQPVDDYYFLPRPFYEAIFRRSAMTNVSPRAWLIHSAIYRVTIPEDGDAESPSPEVVAEFDVEVFQPDTRVRIPFKRDEVRLLEATLDGQAIETHWEAAGDAALFDVETPRRLQLTLSFRPLVNRSGKESVFAVAIPAIARSRVRINTIKEITAVDVPGALGSISRDAVQGEIDVELGPASQLRVAWPSGDSNGESPAEFEVRELFLLRVQPNSVALDAHFQFAIQSGSVRELEILADPRLRLLPLLPDQPVISHSIEEGETQLLRFELDALYDEAVTLKMTFLLDATSGIGNLALPRLQAIAPQRKLPWLGIWAAPSLEFQLPADLQSNPVAVTDFVEAWPDVDPLPHDAFRIPPENASQIVTVLPAQPRTEATLETDISLGSERTTILVQALLALENGHFLQRTLTIPKGLDLRELQVTRDGEDRVKRWADDGQGNLTVFFDRPLNGEHTLLLRGEIRTPKRLPDIALQDATIQSHSIRIFRQPGVNVKIPQSAGMEINPEVTTGVYQAGLGRLAAAYKANVAPEDPKPTARLVVSPNRPVTQGILVTALEFRDEQWLVNNDLILEISKGVVDTIRFDLPRQLGTEFLLTPDLPHELQETSDPDRQVLLARPAGPLRDSAHFRLSSNWQSPDGERTRAPDVRLLDVGQLQRFLVVPSRLGRQQIAWETSGLQASSLPTELSEIVSLETDDQTVFEVVGSRLQATVRDVDRVTGAPQVHLTDVFLTWRIDGTCYGLTTFDLEPARLSEVELEMPSGLDLVQVTVAGLPTTSSRLDNGNWRVPLGAEQLPQRVVVLFHGKLPDTTPYQQQRLAAPSLVGLPVARTLWSIQGPPTVTGGRPTLTHVESDLLSLSRIRRDNASALLGFASEVVAQSATKEMDVWRSAWQRRLACAQQQLVRSGSTTRKAATADPNVDRDGEGPDDSSTLTARTYDPTCIWQLHQEQLGGVSYSSLLGSSSRLQVDYSSFRYKDLGRRGLMAVMLFCLAALAILVRRSRALSEWALRWPYVLGVFLGTAWWLCFTPSILGLVAILVSVVGTLRPNWISR